MPNSEPYRPSQLDLSLQSDLSSQLDLSNPGTIFIGEDSPQDSSLQNIYPVYLTKEEQYIKSKYDQLLKYYSKNLTDDTGFIFFLLFPVLLYENLMNKNKISKIFSEIQDYIFTDKDKSEDVMIVYICCIGFIMNDVEKNYLSIKIPEIKDIDDTKRYLHKVLFSSIPTILIDYNTLLKENITLLTKIEENIDKQNFILFNIETGKLQKIEQNGDFNFDVLVDKIKITFGKKEIIYPRNVTEDNEKQIKKFLVKNIIYNYPNSDFEINWLEKIGEKMKYRLEKINKLQDYKIDNFFTNNPHLIGYYNPVDTDIPLIKKTLYTVYTLFDDEIEILEKIKHIENNVQNLQKVQEILEKYKTNLLNQDNVENIKQDLQKAIKYIQRH